MAEAVGTAIKQQASPDSPGRYRDRQEPRLPRAGARPRDRGSLFPPPPKRSRTNWRIVTCRSSPVRSGCGLSYAVLKGRSNYVCRQRVEELSGGSAATWLLGQDDGFGSGGRAASARSGVRCGGWSPGRGGTGPKQARAVKATAGKPYHGRPGRAGVGAERCGVGAGEHGMARMPGSGAVPFGRRMLRRSGSSTCRKG